MEELLDLQFKGTIKYYWWQQDYQEDLGESPLQVLQQHPLIRYVQYDPCQKSNRSCDLCVIYVLQEYGIFVFTSQIDKCLYHYFIEDEKYQNNQDGLAYF